MTRHPRLAARHLRTGLFVTDLDRPWLDTPFLLQGFLIDRDQEIATLRALCAYVYIDVALSDPLAVRQVRESLDAPLPLAESPAGRADAARVAATGDPAAPEPDIDAALAEADPLAIIDYSTPEAAPQTAVDADDEAIAAPGFELVDDGPAAVMGASEPENAGRFGPADRDPASHEPAAPPRRGGARHAPPDHRAAGEREGRTARSGLGGVLGSVLKVLRAPLSRRELMAALRGQTPEPAASGGAPPAGGPPPKLSTYVDPKLVGKVRVPQGEVLRTSERKLTFDADATDVETRDMPGRGGRVTEVQAELDRELESVLPPGTKRTFYEVRSTVTQEMPRARKAFGECARTLEVLLDDVRSQRTVPVEQAREVVGDMVASMIENPDALLWLAQLRDTHLETYQHSLRVSLYMIAVGRTLGLPRESIESLGLVGILADIGKTRVPRALLDKPGMLSPIEYRIARDHVRLGLKALLDKVQLAPEVRAGIAEHHERIDGSGYPRALKGTQISIWGRIAGIADCFAALITERPYAKAMAPQDALMSLYEWAGTAFHPPLVEQFVQSIGVFPVGSLVELSNGEVAVVLAHNRARRLEPRVIVLADPQKQPLDAPFERDLFMQAAVRGAKPLRIQRGLPAGAHGLKPHDYYADIALPSAQAC